MSVTTKVKETNENALERDLVRLEFVNKRHGRSEGSVTIRHYEDEKGILHTLKDEHGNERPYVFTGSAILNRNKKRDALVIDFLQNDTLYVKRRDPIIRIIDENESAKKNISKQGKVIKTQSLVLGMPADVLKDFARIVGINSDSLSEDAVRSRMLDIAQSNPDKVMGDWNHPQRETITLIHKGLARGVIKRGRMGEYMWNEHQLGPNIISTISFLTNKENADILPHIIKEVEKIK